ncbi:MAG: type II toxin-antitoxin system VapC family toxin [Comamonadaceae bacterium]|nr:MAG: type II toxin-antitoxin system VapC family toxin [Comamonadaceae bacterium]
MIILDTNVVSEPMRATASPAVIEWLDAQASETLYITAVSVAELLTGIEVLPTGKRKKELAKALAELMDTLFADRILAFDQAAAMEYAALTARARSAGRLISMADGMIAAIAASRNFVVATRDTDPFQAAGLTVIDPWAQ